MEEKKEEAISHLTVGVRLLDLARHFSLDEPIPFYPPPGSKTVIHIWKALQKQLPYFHWAWIELHLDDEELLMGIATDQVVQAVSDIGLKVIGCPRVTAKVEMENEEGKSR